MQDAKAGSQTCPHCFRSFRGAHGTAHDGHLQPLLLRCGHTFCHGCISKQVKVLKTSIACPTCKVVTPMPLGEASIKQLPANYYVFGLASWNVKQIRDMFDQKVEFQGPSKLQFKGVQLSGHKELCSSCRCVLATCTCQHCDAIYCEPCFMRAHRGSRGLQMHKPEPLDSIKGRGGCKDHENREFEFFCREDGVPICALCALMGNHKGHDIIQLSDQDQEALKELKPAFDSAKEVLKHQYYALQMTKDAKRDVHKEVSSVDEVVKSAFARLHAILQLREHVLLEQITGIAAQQSQYLGNMLTNITGNISLLESAMIDALNALEEESATVPANVTKLVHTLQSAQELPSHIVLPKAEQQQPLTHFTYSNDLVSDLMSFGSVKVCSKPRLELKTDSELPENWEAPEIGGDVIKNSPVSTHKTDRERARTLSPQGKNAAALSPRTSPKNGTQSVDQKKQLVGKANNTGVLPKASSPQGEAGRGTDSRLVRSFLTPRNSGVLGRELVRVTHIRNPCCFYIQRESDQSQLSSMMVRINKECRIVPEAKRLPDDLSVDSVCCCLYEADKNWYRVRIKSVKYPKLSPPVLTPPQSPDETPILSPVDPALLQTTPQTPPEATPKTDSNAESAVTTTKESGVSLTDGKSETGSEAGSETSSDFSQDILLDVKTIVVPDAKPKVKSKKKTDETQVEVMYIDYGNSETVELSRLCRLKHKHQDVPDLAVCCSLTDIVPTRKSGRWSAEAVNSFAKMVGEKPVYMSILGHSGATLYVDLHKPPVMEVENDMPMSLRDALVFLELACFVSPDSVPSASPSRGQPLKFIAPDLPVQGEEIVVTVSHFQDPLCFCVQEIGPDCQYLIQMMKDMQSTYSKSLDDRWNILCPKMGTICIAHFSEDGQWSRAEVVGLPGKQEVDVLYVDYGNYERVHVSKLRKIAKKFLKLCVQALPCSLVDVGPKDPEKGWTTEEAEGFGQIVLTKVLRATIKGIEKGRLSVILMEDRQDREININALMVQKGFAQSTGPGSVSAAIIFDISQSDYSDDDTVKNEDIVSSDSGTDTQSTMTTTNKVEPSKLSKTHLSPKLTSQYTAVHVSHVESPGCIYIQLSTAGRDGLDNLVQSMTTVYKQAEMTEGATWQEGDLCSALMVREGVWCRGRIRTILPDDNAVILFTDYGNTEVVSFSNIRPLLEKFQKDPPFAIQCHLADVTPGGDKRKWTRTACEFLATALSDLECVIVKKGDLENGSLPIDLLYERSIEEKLEQQTTEDLGSIAKLLLLKGLALPVKHGPPKSPTKSTDPASLDLPSTPNSIPTTASQSSKPIPSTTTFAVQKDPLPSTPQLVNGQLPISQNAVGETVAKDNIPKYPSLPLPPSGRIELVITYVSPSGVIYGLEASKVSTFRDVMDRLQAANAIRQPIPTASELNEGQAVCAQFQEDGLWYRAKITAIDKDSVEVHYVDFGNSEVVPLTSVHSKAFMLDMPGQSRECTLMGLRPKLPNSSWSTETIQFLLENLVEQTCTALIKSLCKQGEPLKVDLLLPTGQSIVNLLLDHGLAETDESENDSNHSYPTLTEAVEDKRDDVSMVTANQRAVSPDVGVAMAGLEVKYTPMRVPAKGSFLTVSVTHINQPDLVYIQPWAEDSYSTSPAQQETYDQLIQLQKMSADLNKMAPSLPSVVNPQAGQCCCTLYQVNQQWYRTVIRQIKTTEKLCEVQFVDYGTSEWVPTKGLRQIPERFTTLPMQARLCKLIGLKPPALSAPNEGTTLPDSDWPMASVDKLLDLVSNKKLFASIQYEAAVPGIILYETAKTLSPSLTGKVQPRRPIHLVLIEAGLAQLDKGSSSDETSV